MPKEKQAFYITVALKHEPGIPLVQNMLGFFVSEGEARMDAVNWAASSNIVKWNRRMTRKQIEDALDITIEPRIAAK